MYENSACVRIHANDRTSMQVTLTHQFHTTSIGSHLTSKNINMYICISKTYTIFTT